MGITIILDWDQTLVAYKLDRANLHPEHKLSEYKRTIRSDATGEIEWSVELINPRELSDVIQDLCQQNPGNKFMILTSGCWNGGDAVHLLCIGLDITPEATMRLSQAKFHSASSDHKYFPGKTLKDVRELNKDVRLEAIIKNDPTLQNEHFLIVDDKFENITCFKRWSNVTGVLARTHIGDSGDKNFYKEICESSMTANKRKKEQAEQALLEEAYRNSIIEYQRKAEQSLLEETYRNSIVAYQRKTEQAEESLLLAGLDSLLSAGLDSLLVAVDDDMSRVRVKNFPKLLEEKSAPQKPAQKRKSSANKENESSDQSLVRKNPCSGYEKTVNIHVLAEHSVTNTRTKQVNDKQAPNTANTAETSRQVLQIRV